MTKTLVILRGLPGSGKTFTAKEMTRGVDSYAVLSGDHFFTGDDGVYRFDASRLGQAHAACQVNTHRSMVLGVELIIVDNTNSRHWEYQIYLEMAQAFGYDVEIKTIGGRSFDDIRTYAKRCVHEVPEEAILKMAYRWED